MQKKLQKKPKKKPKKKPVTSQKSGCKKAMRMRNEQLYKVRGPRLCFLARLRRERLVS